MTFGSQVRLHPNLDIQSMTLGRVLDFTAQFLDGRLQGLILVNSDFQYGWKVTQRTPLVFQHFRRSSKR